MDDNEIRDVVAEKAGVSTGVVDRVLVALQETVLLGLRQNEDVALVNLGVWNRPTSNGPAFVFTVPVGEPDPPVPDHLIQDLTDCHEQRSALADFLRANSPREDFGYEDRYPGLDPSLKPEPVTRKEVNAEAHRGNGVVSSRLVADRVVRNLRATLG